MKSITCALTGAAAIVAFSGVASATFYTTTDTGNGLWDADATAGGQMIVSLDTAQNQGPLTPGESIQLDDCVSAVANGAAAANDTLGFSITFDAAEGTTEFSFLFAVPVTAVAWTHFNTFVTTGITASTGLNTYDVEALEGGGFAGEVGIVEAAPFSELTFTMTDPNAGSELWFADSPLRYVKVPAPGAAALLAIGGAAGLRRRR
ncbi:MAG: hypothetical protein AAFX05_01935 [Planctomycetota bacterium]